MELRGVIMWLRETAKLRVPDKVIVDNDAMRITECRVPIGVVSTFVLLLRELELTSILHTVRRNHPMVRSTSYSA